jgi:hypothetical protein
MIGFFLTYRVQLDVPSKIMQSTPLPLEVTHVT